MDDEAVERRRADARIEVVRRRQERAEAETRWAHLLTRLKVGDPVSGTITDHEPFGAFVALDDWGFPGLLHRLDQLPPVGSRVDCVVSGLDHGHEVYLILA